MIESTKDRPRAETLRVTFDLSAKAMRGRLRGLASVVALALSIVLPARAADPPPVWFVVAERNVGHNDSFLLPLTDPADIAQARARIAQGDASGVGSIAVLDIASGSDGLNRDVRADGAPLWSWHVVRFHGFADNAIELCDGWPGFIEQNVAAFIANTGGTVCFWGYSVVAELSQAPRFAINEALDGAWYNPGTDGQGLMLDVLAKQGQVFAAWFTWPEDGPGTSSVGSPEHRWLSAQGPFAIDTATLTLTLTRGGAFNSARPVQHSANGSLTLTFSDCNHGQASFAVNGGPSGTFPLQRLVPLATCGVR